MSSTTIIFHTACLERPQTRRYSSFASLDSILDDVKKDGRVIIFRFKKDTELKEDFVDEFTFNEEIWNRSLDSDIVILDLSNVSFINEVFAGKLYALNKRLTESGVALGIFGLGEIPREKFGIFNMLDKLSVGENEAAAIAMAKESLTERPKERTPMLIKQFEPLQYSGSAISDVSVLSFLTPESPINEGNTAVFQFKENTNLISSTVNPDTFCGDILSKCRDSEKVILHLRNVDLMDKSIITGVIGLYNRLKAQQKKLGICCTDNLYEKLKVFNLHKLFPIESDFDALVNALAK